MRMDPAIAGLRCDPAPQLRAQAALEGVRDNWHRVTDVPTILAEFHSYGVGAPIEECPRLASVLSDHGLAKRLLDLLFRPMIAALAGHPLGHVPFRHQFTPGLMVLQLAVSARAALSLVCYQARVDGAPPDIAQTVCFTDGERREICLKGTAEARFFTILRERPGSVDLETEPRVLVPGDVLFLQGARHTKIVDSPHRQLTLLRLSRTENHPVPAREFRISDGTLVHRASGDRSESRDEMAAAVLGAMGRRDAAPVLADIARSPGSEHFRWQALRQGLALDSGIGFTVLTEIASDPGNTLAPLAGALRASLIETHPAFADWINHAPRSDD